MKRIVVPLALVGFVLALAVHLSAVMGTDAIAKAPLVWGLHIAMFVVFLPFVLDSQKTFGRKPTLAQLRAHFPAWVLGCAALLAAYAMVNFALFALNSEGGMPDIRDGRFVVQSHGNIIRELTAAEYAAKKLAVTRAFSGHWLLFYFLPLAHFGFMKRGDAAARTV